MPKIKLFSILLSSLALVSMFFSASISTSALDLPTTTDYTIKLAMDTPSHIMTRPAYNNPDYQFENHSVLIQESTNHGTIMNNEGIQVFDGDTLRLADFLDGFTYFPEDAYSGSDRFTFRIYNGEYYSNISSYNLDIVRDYSYPEHGDNTDHLEQSTDHLNENHNEAHETDHEESHSAYSDGFICEPYAYQCPAHVGGGGENFEDHQRGDGGESVDPQDGSGSEDEALSSLAPLPNGTGGNQPTPLIRTGGQAPQSAAIILFTAVSSFAGLAVYMTKKSF